MNESGTLVAVVTQGNSMDAAAVAAIGAMVTVLVQITKRSLPGDCDCYGPLICAFYAFAGVALWIVSAPAYPPLRTDLWAIGAGWVAVFSTAVGLYQSVKMVTATGSVSRASFEREETEPADPPAPRGAGQIPGVTGRG